MWWEYNYYVSFKFIPIVPVHNQIITCIYIYVCIDMVWSCINCDIFLVSSEPLFLLIRMFEWMFARVNSQDVTDEIRAIYLQGLQKVRWCCCPFLGYVFWFFLNEASLLIVCSNLSHRCSFCACFFLIEHPLQTCFF